LGRKLLRKGKFYVYILQSRNSLFYTGFTKDLEERLHRHNHGRGGRFTPSKRPVRLVYYEVYDDRASAMRREKQIKDFSQRKKRELVRRFRITHLVKN